MKRLLLAKTFRVIMALAAAALVLVAYNHTAGKSTASTAPAVVTASAGSKGVIYLTFDDGPTTGYTTQILADLNAAHVHATFFEVGEQIQKTHCVLTREELADGDQIGTHSWGHPDFTELGQPSPTLKLFGVQTQGQVERARNLQVTCTDGYNSGLFRYPHAHRTNWGDKVLAANGLVPVYSDISPHDYYTNASDNMILSQIVPDLHNGAVIGLHDGNGTGPMERAHPTYLPTLIKDIKAEGYTFGVLNAQHLPVAATTVSMQPDSQA